ncbi:MAG: YeeE/YedE family protein [Rhodospirillaceae bacterium]|nr:YeeE/YedE family protein [Rhodospirillaceae bacterium]
MPTLTDRVWSPYLAGVIIGLLQIPAFLLADTALGASSSFVTAAGFLASTVDSGVAQIDYFVSHMTSGKYFWQSALVIGIAIGAFVSARASRSGRPSFSGAWTRLVGVRSFWARSAMAFAGGFVMLLGARIAGGCTSGHGISGMAQLAIGSFAAVAAMFAGGILVASLFRRA